MRRALTLLLGNGSALRAAQPERGIEHRLRRNSVVVFSILNSLALIAYGCYNIISAIRWVGVAELVFSIVSFAVTIRFAVLDDRIEIPIRLLLTETLLLTVYLLASGGLAGTGAFWILMFPLSYFFFEGRRRGSVWFVAQTLIIVSMCATARAGLIAIAYQSPICLVMLGVLVVHAAFMYLYERVKCNLLAEIRVLRGMLPICSYCKKVRDDHGFWVMIDAYVASHSDTQFSHGICPDCAKQHFPEVARSQRSENRHTATQ